MPQKIKFIGVPPGQAPDWVRKEWIGVEVPLIEGPPLNPALLAGALGGKADPRSFGGYRVEPVVAFAALREKSPEAADWWETRFPPGRSGLVELVFARDVCELVG